MISADFFYQILSARGADYFCGVPDSLLKDFCAYIQDKYPERNIITANEGGAAALASGYYLASGKPAVVYMQNSGIGNALNPLLSLADPGVYGIPMILIIGWRGGPGVKDEPQHVRQGQLTCPLLDTMEIPYSVLAPNSENIEAMVNEIIDIAEAKKGPAALIIKKGFFEKYVPQNNKPASAELKREEAIAIAAEAAGPNDAIVATTGKISRELYEYRKNRGQSGDGDFLTVGSMGHASQIAAGIASQKPGIKVFCFDGDGAVLMHLGALAINASLNTQDFVHLLFNNCAHDSVGGQPTVGDKVDFPTIASACGYKWTGKARTESELRGALAKLLKEKGPAFLEIAVKKGSRPDLGRPSHTPQELKERFSAFLKKRGPI